MPRGKHRRDTFCRAFALTAGVISKKETKPSLVCRERQFGRHFVRDNLGEGNRESEIAARQWGVNLRREACLDVSQGSLVLETGNPGFHNPKTQMLRQHQWHHPDSVKAMGLK